jgi:hypothetical protein
MTMNRRHAKCIHKAPRSVRTIRFLLRRSAGDRHAMPIALERSPPSCAGRCLSSRFSNRVMSDFVTSTTTASTTMAANRPAASKLLWAVAIDGPTAWREPRTSADNGADSGRAPRSQEQPLSGCRRVAPVQLPNRPLPRLAPSVDRQPDGKLSPKSVQPFLAPLAEYGACPLYSAAAPP